MNSSISFSQFDNTSKIRVKKVEAFLNSVELELSPDIEVFVSAKEKSKMIACGGLSGNVLKCIAVSPEKRGEGFVLSVMTELLNAANDRGRKELFIYSTPKNIAFFEECGFQLIEECDSKIILMENSKNLKKYKNNLSRLKKDGNVIGSIVMNANPFTLGHRYLVEEAAKKSDHLHIFVVREDASDFSFKDRINLIQKGLADIENITIHEGSDYIISKATFPTYFIKDKCSINELHAKLDLSIFRNQIAPSLNITHRFVGTEPYCTVTNNYNQNMKKVLGESNPKSNNIEVIEIERKEYKDKAISASSVRALLKDKKYDELSNIVPPTTFDFLVKRI
ncbi:[citrate (pro-3S)-lyase] ligase [Sulfurospirillum arcachonense]|uniref:[citrate (pro-3S)-lyase] ligase n=1 Tax=Sulfurospirillum arcachonense TaxID=57666 RepID=UPI00046AEEBF|nr:[citrate (pro-3S)-lyase] ligase [Sulfurospirillum arcachonense]